MLMNYLVKRAKNKPTKSVNRAPTVYISGPMSLHQERGWNHDRFNFWAKHFRKLGLKVMNPAEHDPDTTKDWLTYIINDLKWIREEHPEYIFSLNEWQLSEGATIELIAVQRIGGKQITEDAYRMAMATSGVEL